MPAFFRCTRGFRFGILCCCSDGCSDTCAFSDRQRRYGPEGKNKVYCYRKLCKGNFKALTDSNTTCINIFLFSLVFLKKLLSFQCKFSSKTKFGESLKAQSCKIIRQRMLKYNQQQDINRTLGCVSGADQTSHLQRMLIMLTAYFMWANQSCGS